MAGTGLADIAALVAAVETADSKGAMVTAVRRLASVQDGDAIPTLIKVLGYNNPGAAVAAVDGLVALGTAAVPALLEQLDGYNYGARAWAIRALSLIGDPRALPVLLEAAAGDFALSVRRAATRGIGAINWASLPAGEIAEAQAHVLRQLINATNDPEWVVRYAAVVGLQGLSQVQANSPNPAGSTAIVEHLRQVLSFDDSPAVQARAQWALASLGA